MLGRLYLVAAQIAMAAIFLTFTAPAARGQESSPTPAATPIVLESTPLVGVLNVVVPTGPLLVVKTRESINSYSAHSGEKIRYEVVQDFVVDGYLIAKQGDVAEGQVEEDQQGKLGFDGIGYKAANLRVSVDKVYTYCGSTLELHFDRSEYRRRQGIFGSEKDVNIVEGQKYSPSVDHPQTVCATKTTEPTLPIGTDVIPSDKG